MARGARRRKSAFTAPLEIFALSEFTLRFRKDREMQTLSGAVLIDYFHGIRGDGLLLSAAGVAMELVRKTVHPGAPLPGLFDLTAAFLRRLDSAAGRPKDYSEKLIWLYMLGFLKIMGFAPSLSSGSPSPYTGRLSEAARRELLLLQASRIEEIEGKPFRQAKAINAFLADFLSACFEKNLRLNCLEFYYSL